jgi:hypothetical protein
MEFSRRSLGEPEPVTRLSPAESVAEVERLRRLFIERFGDPDEPLERVVTRRPLDGAG